MRRDTIRLPLQAGDAPLVRGAICAVIASTGAALIISLGEDTGSVTHFFGMMFYVLAMTVFLFSLPLRASDAEIGKDDLTIEGGPHDGATFLWQEIDCAKVHIDKVKNAGQGTSLDHLWVVERDGREFPIAAARGASGKAALGILREVVVAAPAWREGVSIGQPAAAERRATTVLTCAACGAALRPSTDLAKCPYCEATVTVPAELAARIDDARAMGEGRAHLDALVDRLLALPSAHRTNVFLAAACVAMCIGFPVAAATLDTPAVVAVAVGASLVAFLLAWMHVVDRQALRVLLTAFAAPAPRKPGEPDRCRRCDGPLPEPKGDGAVVRCVYCNADNVLGLDVGIRGEITRESTDLEQALAFRGRRRNLARAAVALTAIATTCALIVAARSA